MLHLSTVDDKTINLLRKLQSLPELQHTRLVGGTALALQIGHRKSIDLDLFGLLQTEPLELTGIVRKIGSLIVLKDSHRIHSYVLEGVKVDIIQYEYPWLNDLFVVDDIRMAGLEDIAAMKVMAVVGRGTKKDFIDIAFLLRYFSLSEMLEYYSRKYPEASLFMAVKSLAYFEDAEKEVSPFMLKPVSWENIKEQIREEVKRL